MSSIINCRHCQRPTSVGVGVNRRVGLDSMRRSTSINKAVTFFLYALSSLTSSSTSAAALVGVKMLPKAVAMVMVDPLDFRTRAPFHVAFHVETKCEVRTRICGLHSAFCLQRQNCEQAPFLTFKSAKVRSEIDFGAACKHGLIGANRSRSRSRSTYLGIPYHSYGTATASMAPSSRSTARGMACMYVAENIFS